MPEESKPLTRQDVIEAIKDNGSTAEGLDLSGADMRGIDLHKDDDLPTLRGIILKKANLSPLPFPDGSVQVANLQDARLWDANLQDARLWRANLRGAILSFTNLQGASLTMAKLQSADLRYANLQGALLSLAELSGETRLEEVNWGPDYILGDESEGGSKVRYGPTEPSKPGTSSTASTTSLASSTTESGYAAGRQCCLRCIARATSKTGEPT